MLYLLLVGLPLAALVAFVVILNIPGGYATFLEIFFGSATKKGKWIPPLSDPKFPFGNVLQWNDSPQKMVDLALKNTIETGGIMYHWMLFTPIMDTNRIDFMKQIGSLNFTIKSSTRKPGEILPVWKKLFGNGLFMVGSDQWKRMHKIAIRGMGSNKMRLYLPSILQSADRVIGTLESQALDAKEKGEKKFAVNTTVLFRNYATEAIMKVGFGESLNKEEILKLGKKFAHAMELGSEPQSMFNAYLMLPLESNKKLWRDIDELHAVGKALVNKFRDKDSKLKDTGSLLQALCEASDGDEMFTEDECVHNVYSFIGAGIDTTSTALTHCVTLMALYPDIQEKVRAEILEDDSKEDFTMEKALQGFPYTSAFIKETLRLFPPVVGLPARETTKAVTLGDFTIGPNTSVSCNSLVCGRSKSIWGEDAQDFRPERFLETSEGRTKTGGVDIANNMGAKFMTFGIGVRTCIGKHLSIMEIKVVLAKILRKYRIENPNTDKLNTKSRHWNINVVFCKVKPELSVLSFVPL